MYFNEYLIKGFLSQGSQSQLYLARDSNDSCDIALQLLLYNKSSLRRIEIMEKVKNVEHTIQLLSAIVDPEVTIQSSRLTKQFLYLQTQRSVIAVYKYHRYPPLSHQTFLTE